MASRLTQPQQPADDVPAAQLTPVRSALKALETSGALGRALPSGLSAQRFSRIILTELSKNPALEKCHPPTILGAVMTAAQLGLEFGPLGHAYLVPFRNNKTNRHECQLIIGYRGMIDLARRSGQLVSIVARPVHERDHFDFEFGTDEHLTHRPNLTGPRGDVTLYYGVARFADGGYATHVMSRADIEKFRRRSATQNKPEPSGPWLTDYDAMACKTVIRRMWPWLPSSVAAAQAIETDEAVITWNGTDTEIAHVIDVDPVDELTEPGPSAGAIVETIVVDEQTLAESAAEFFARQPTT